MQIEIICVGKLKEHYLKDACSEYEKRLSRFCKLHITELKDEAIYDETSAVQILQAQEKEAEKILAKLLPRDHVIALCVEGKDMPSESFAKTIQEVEESGAGRLVFIIGGSWGLLESVKKKSHLKLSFSKFTFPHQLMRVILLEQIYRAYKINAKESYHK